MTQALIPHTGRIAGVDYGTVRIGIAICDQSQSIASPYEQYSPRSPSKDRDYFVELARDERLVGWVVGLPIHLSGDESEKSKEARRFAEWIESTTQLPVVLFDERFTTSIAREILGESGLSAKKRKKKLDQIAAQILLKSFLESDRQQSINEGIDDE